MGSASERRRYTITSSHIGWAQNDPCNTMFTIKLLKQLAPGNPMLFDRPFGLIPPSSSRLFHFTVYIFVLNAFHAFYDNVNNCHADPGIILCIDPGIERWRYIVTSSLIAWVHTQNDRWDQMHNTWICHVLSWAWWQTSSNLRYYKTRYDCAKTNTSRTGRPSGCRLSNIASVTITIDVCIL